MNAIVKNKKQNTMTGVNLILLITTTLTGLSAGLLYAYACSVNLGLGRLPDREYLAAMQSINKEILNPVFFAGFFGALILLPVSTYLNYGQPLSSRFIFLLVATLIYVIGVFGVTSLGNVPLNNILAGVNLQSTSPAEITKLRINFEVPWNRLHGIRTIASIVSLVLVILACLNKVEVASK